MVESKGKIKYSVDPKKESRVKIFLIKTRGCQWVVIKAIGHVAEVVDVFNRREDAIKVINEIKKEAESYEEFYDSFL